MLALLYKHLKMRVETATADASYTRRLLDKGTPKVAQKVGEEAVEVVIEAMAGNKERLIYESADLLYHLTVLWVDQGVSIEDIEKELQKRSKPA